MATQREGSSKGNGGGSGIGVSIDDAIGADLLHNILSRLPASSFASAACVNRSWNSICSRILSSPKLSSALSLNPSLQEAVDEVLQKVLSEPIRPQFAIVHVGPRFYPDAHRLITERLGSGVPVITSLTDGTIGRDALTDEFKEIMWEMTEDDEFFGEDKDLVPNYGISLTVGYLPGIKTNMIPLSSRDEELRDLLINEFVMDIRKYTSSVSRSASPTGIIIFADLKTDMRPVLQKMDYAFPPGTIIVGEGGGRLRYRSNWQSQRRTRRQYILPAIALVFVKDRNKPPGIGETNFHVAISTGTTSVGPNYKAASVKEKHDDRCTWLTARREGVNENLDGQTIIQNVYDEAGEHVRHMSLYVGIKKRRKCSIGLEKVRWQTFLEFHEVLGGDEEYLYVNEIGIRTGDTFQFYTADSNIAMSTCNNVSDNFRCLKEDFDKTKNHQQAHIGSTSNGNKESFFGGFIFACCGRGAPFFGRPNIDSWPFLENFPGVPIAGSFCNGEIKRGHTNEYGQEEQRGDCCFLHAFSTVYLVLSYTPAQP